MHPALSSRETLIQKAHKESWAQQYTSMIPNIIFLSRSFYDDGPTWP